MPPHAKKIAEPIGQAKSFPKEHWEHILASLEEGLVIMDRQGRVAFFNPTAEHLTGLSQSQVLLRSYTQVFNVNPWIIRMVKHTLLSSSSRTAGEGELIGKPYGKPYGEPHSKPYGEPHGKPHHRTPVRLTSSPILDSTGTSLGIVLVIHDLSHQKGLEEDVKQVDRLAHLGMVAAGLAHEIKNPLAGIRGAAQLLQGKLTADPQVHDYTKVMIREIDRLNTLLERLLQLTTLPRLERRPTNIHKVLNDVLLLEKETVPANITILTYFDPSLPEVLGDETQLTQVFRNLIKNALQALANQPVATLTITTRMETNFHILYPRNRRGRLLCIDIEDNGPGIAPEHLSLLFTPLFTTKSEGAGLGLAISQHIISEHGGTIRVEGKPGRGAWFKVILPMVTPTDTQ
jgi:two-component system nitrogen regulation sensor histidine kinase GlnL